MRVTKLFVLAALAVALFPATSEARSRWSINVGYNSGGWCGSGGGLSIGYGYSYGYRPSFVYGGGHYRSYCPPAYSAPVHYAPRYYAPAYCPPPVYYSTPRFNNCDYGYSAPVYYSTPRFSDRSYVSVSYGSGYGYDRGYTYVNRGYSYVDRGYNYCPPARSYSYSSYYRR